jgi:hypothetical protein
LPPEIRSNIWTFAVKVDLVYIKCAKAYPLRPKGHAVTDATHKRQLSAFHLLQVCRQVYTETATLAYSTNTFLIGLHPDGPLSWIRALSLVQREAITRVELEWYYWYHQGIQNRVSLRSKGLVKLTHCHVSIGVQQQLKRGLHIRRVERMPEDQQSWIDWITTTVKTREGQDMVVEVH